MLKRILSFLLTLALFLGAASAIAEADDLSEMTFEELAELRTLITAEMLTRPEGEEIVLSAGEYVVGRDLQPGTYYAIYESGQWSGGSIYVYEDETKGNRLAWITTVPSSYDVYPIRNLAEGNIVVIEGNKLRTNMVGFPDYHAPEGTLIPPGVYEIGVDIPAGRYSVSLNGDETFVYVYKTKEAYLAGKTSSREREMYYLAYKDKTCVVSLQDGQIFVIDDSSVIMSKYDTVFTFD